MGISYYFTPPWPATTLTLSPTIPTEEIPVDYGTLLGVVGGSAVSDPNPTKTAIFATNVSKHAGCLFTLNTEPNRIYIEYAPTNYPTGVTFVMAYDGLVALMVRKDISTATMTGMPDAAYARTGATLAYQIGYLNRVNHHSAPGAPVFLRAIPGAGTTQTSQIQSHPMLL